jgi:hypothetical protein
MGAVAHAIARATGVWVTDMPLTPEKILKALKEKQYRDERGTPEEPKGTWQEGRPSEPFKPKPVVGKRAPDPKTVRRGE